MPTEETSAWANLVVDPVKEMLTQVLGYLPKLLGALLILIIGWIVARIIRRVIDEVLKIVRLDSLADKAGITAVLEKGNVKITTRQVVSGLVYWLIMIMVFAMAVDALELGTASEQVLANLFKYIPNVIAAMLAIIVGMFLATFVAGIVRLAAANANMQRPDVLAGICRWVIIIFTATVALTQLGITFVEKTFQIVLGGVVLAAAIAIGLGAKDAVARYIEELRQKKN
jgi:hypothetical protein